MNGYTINLGASTFSLYKITNIVYVQRWSNLQLKKNLQVKCECMFMHNHFYLCISTVVTA